MNNLLEPKRFQNWVSLSGRACAVLLVPFLVTACVQSAAEPAPTGLEDVDDIPIPSQDLDDDDDDTTGDDDDTTASDDDDDTTGDDDDTTGDDDDDTTGDDDDTTASDDDDTTGDDDDTTGDDDDTTGDDDDTTPVETTPVSYTVADDESLLYIQVFKDPNSLFSSFAHDHVMRATNWNGSFQYDPADLSSCSFNISINVADLLVDEDAMRSYVGYGDTINTNDRTTIRENMLDEGQLNSDNFPLISVTSQTCGTGSGAGTTNGNLPVTAEMTLRGVNRTKSLTLDLTIQGGEAYMQGSFQISATEFGFTPYQFLGGGVRNLDDMTISFDMVGVNNN